MQVERRKESFFRSPDFWLSDFDQFIKFAERVVNLGQIEVMGNSAGGRRLISISYGEKEPVFSPANRSSALASRCPESYFNPLDRKKSVVVIISTIHGAEMEGMVSLVNLINIMETGQDLRGKPWVKLQELASKVRLVLVPVVNPDGRVRSRVSNLIGSDIDDIWYYGQGALKNGDILRWPACKEEHPRIVEKMEFLGGYYNDNGYNIQHDNIYGTRQPETEALLNLVLEEIPDLFLSFHSCDIGPRFLVPDDGIGIEYQLKQAQVSAVATNRLYNDGYEPYWPPCVPLGRTHLQTAINDATGALPLLLEMPHGCVNKPYTFDQIVDIGLLVIEELLLVGQSAGYRP
jgi:hypothetical protein